MTKRASLITAVWVLFFVSHGLTHSLFGQTETEQESRAARRLRMVARIDELINARIAASDRKGGEACSDTEFARRVSLDLTGVVPREQEARAFATDDRTDKRPRWIEQCLASGQHANHLANTWRNLLLPGGLTAENAQAAVPMQSWLRERFASNLRYDNLVSDLLVSTSGDTTGPSLYFTSLELAPEKLAASSAKIFLGLQLECAQCHDHPFDDWKQRDFWGYAAFFAQLQRNNGPANDFRQPQRIVDLDRGEVYLPNSEEVVPPKYIGGAVATANTNGSRRLQLAIWIASRDNPYLAPAAVNRCWQIMLGRGLVEPVDDLAPQNPASHPELLQELTDYFVETGFDLRELFRTIALTQTYQRTSRWQEAEPPPEELYVVRGVKSLSPEQIFDSWRRIAGGPSSPPEPLQDAERFQFLVRMQTTGQSPLDYPAGILQALSLMNGSSTQQRTDTKQSPLLVALQAPWLNDAQKPEEIYWTVLSRPPTNQERSLLEKELSAVSAAERPAVLADLLWALLNSAEFALNH